MIRMRNIRILKKNIRDGFRNVITYSPKPNTIKDVVFFVGVALTKEIKPQEEEVSKAWFANIDEALKIVTYDDDKKVLNEAIKFMNKEEK